ncbi:hypothetical protein HMPREF1579_00431, partial [Gardnerella vaginalis JCP8066]
YAISSSVKAPLALRSKRSGRSERIQKCRARFIQARHNINRSLIAV